MLSFFQDMVIEPHFPKCSNGVFFFYNIRHLLLKGQFAKRVNKNSQQKILLDVGKSDSILSGEYEKNNIHLLYNKIGICVQDGDTVCKNDIFPTIIYAFFFFFFLLAAVRTLCRDHPLIWKRSKE